ncbi:MAG: permease prefix domain 1-containing protein [Gemmatimonadota bacterium]
MSADSRGIGLESADAGSESESTELESQIGKWRSYLGHRGIMNAADMEELEDHLRQQIDGLVSSGLHTDEAFLIAVKRLGALDDLSREFAREHSERLWKQMVVPGGGASEPGTWATPEARVVLALAVAAGAMVKLPALLGLLEGAREDWFYALNAPLLVLPFLTAYFLWKRGRTAVHWALPAGVFVAFALVVNFYPFVTDGHTQTLTALHLPIALWLLVGLAYAGQRWREVAGRMDFIRFSGEFFIYFVLIAVGGGILIAFTLMVFESIRMDAEWFVQQWIAPCGAAGAVLVAGWLVEAKQSVVENMAPVLARIFAPLFAILLLAFLATMLVTGQGINVEREVLIAFDLLLALVLGLLLYSISARDPVEPAGLMDGVLLVLVVSALLVDVLALGAIASRISDFGFTPNRVAALGENTLLLANLSVSAWLYFRFITGRRGFAALERWQTRFLPLFAIWAAVVVLVFPPLFGWW